ncbi:MAG: NUDIX hydrolase [Microbacteriaceae bacterium]
MTEPKGLADDPHEVPVLAHERVFDGKVWDIVREEFRYGDESIVREYVDHTGAVAILALDANGQVLLIKQYRHPVRRRDWEIPAGLLDVVDEDPLAAAKRELAEEADLTAQQWNVLVDFYTSPGGSSEAIRVYLARGLHATDAPFARQEEEAGIQVKWAPLDEVVDAVLARTLQNPSLAIGVLAAQAARRGGFASLGAADEPWASRPRAGQQA